MRELTNIKNELTLDSREVAEMVGKRHADLLRDIMIYVKHLGQNAKLRSDDFFVESAYKAGTGKNYKCYLVTRKGCEMIAHKLTGEKGIFFTATYIDKFHEMESELQQNVNSYMIADPIQRAERWIEEEKERQQLLMENKQKEQIIGELKPKADYTDLILKNKGLVTITQIAKDYGMSGRKMNKLLNKLKVQYKQSGQWLLYKEHHGKGYTHSETVTITRTNGSPDIKMNTKWTQKGRLFLYDLLKESDVLPLIEQG